MTTATADREGADAIGAAEDESLAEFQWQVNLLFTRARLLWKESAARVHPDLQPAGYKLLGFVARAGVTNAHLVAEAFEMDKSVVSRQVKALEELGLVVSRPDEGDGRQRVLAATPLAHEALRALRADHAERLRAALDGLTPDELAAAIKAIRCLSEL